MLARIRKIQEEREGGFTLIELLVVIIIIGILAAVAIPVFLNQRTKGYDAAAKSDLRNLAMQEETYLTDAGEYVATTADSTFAAGTIEFKQSDGVAYIAKVPVTPNNNEKFCLAAKHKNSSAVWVYKNDLGGLQPLDSTITTLAAGCP